MRIILLVYLLLMSGCTRYIFFPTEEHVLTPDALGVRYEDIHVQTWDDLSLHGWKLFAEGDVRATILFFHGNAENISTHFANVYWLTEHGFDVYLFDYRGYGKSEGNAALDPIVDDMQVLIGHVVDALPANENFVVMGQSLGASLSIYAVAHGDYRSRIAALVSVSAFSDYHDIAQDALAKTWVFWLFQWPLSKTISNTYSPVKVVDRAAPVPFFIMHSESDEIIPFYHAQRLYEAAGEPKQLITLEGGHNVTFSLERNRRALLSVLDEIATD